MTTRTYNGITAWSGETFVNDLNEVHHVSLQHLKEGGEIAFFGQRLTAGSMVTHLPQGTQWSNYSTDPAHIASGGWAMISRATNVFHIWGQGITFASATFPTITDHVVTAGQSMMTGLEDFPGMMLAQVPGTGLIGTAAGGSSIYPPDPDGYWIETDNTTPGPLLTAALTAMSGKTIKAILWAQGHDNRDELESGALTEAQYKAGVLAVLGQLGWDGTSSGVPVIVEMPGCIPDGNGGGWQKVRNVYQDILSEPYIRGYEVYDLERKDGTHLTDEAQQIAAHRAGLMLANPTFEPLAPTVTVLHDRVTLLEFSEPVEFTEFHGASEQIERVYWNDDMDEALVVHDPGTLRYPWREGLGLSSFSRGHGLLTGQFALGSW